MRFARSVATLDPVDVGDHVCWLVGPEEDFAGSAGAFVAGGALVGDKVLVVGPAGTLWAGPAGAPGVTVVDPAVQRTGGVRWDSETLLGVVRREADVASREGFRALRVLAQMEHLWPDGAGARSVAGYELSLDSVVAGGGALVVCAYRRDRFASCVMDQATGVHPQHLGTRHAVALSFRMFSQGPGCWSVSGVVDAEGADAFGIAVGELAARSATVQLLCEELELMDAAGMRALLAAVDGLPGRRVVLRGANPTLRRVWGLLGFDAAAVSVELAP